MLNLKELKGMPGKKLHLGCGQLYMAGWVNADISKNVKSDVCFDFNKKKWPFKDNEFDIVYTSNVLEHLSDTIDITKELWRITKPEGVILIDVPYATSFVNFRDPTHKSRFSKQTFAYFTDDYGFNFYSDIRFKAKSRIHYFGHPDFLKVFNYLIDPFVNFFWKIYEMKFAYIFPSDNIVYELRPIK